MRTKSLYLAAAVALALTGNAALAQTSARIGTAGTTATTTTGTTSTTGTTGTTTTTPSVGGCSGTNGSSCTASDTSSSATSGATVTSPTFNSTLDANERIGQMVGMLKLLSDEVPAFVLYYNPSIAAHVSTVRGPDSASLNADVWNIYEWELA